MNNLKIVLYQQTFSIKKRLIKFISNKHDIFCILKPHFIKYCLLNKRVCKYAYKLKN